MSWGGELGVQEGLAGSWGGMGKGREEQARGEHEQWEQGAVDSLGRGLGPASALPSLCVRRGATLLKGTVLCVSGFWVFFLVFFLILFLACNPLCCDLKITCS